MQKTEKFKRLGTFEPWIVFPYSCIREWARDGLTFSELKELSETLRQEIKRASGYCWSNCHFHVSDIHGTIAVTIQFYTHIRVWDFRGRSLPSIKSLDEAAVRWFQDVLDQIHKGNSFCNDCGKWLHHEEGWSYSYAGWVCRMCYDPEKHLPPDTRGD